MYKNLKSVKAVKLVHFLFFLFLNKCINTNRSDAKWVSHRSSLSLLFDKSSFEKQ